MSLTPLVPYHNAIIGKVVCLEGEPDARESGRAIISFCFVWVEIMEVGLASALAPHLHNLTIITYSAKQSGCLCWPGLQLDCAKRGRR